ncbi:MAG TPA: nuclear transport factor 2 family protein [Solirubrobacteraceae bacterium]|jgi:ketosteroid isomerase-like protein
MSQENVEIAKRAIDAFNLRDFDGYNELWRQDAEWFPAMAGIVEGSGGYRGREGLAAFSREVGNTWEDFQVIADEYRDVDDRVLLLCRIAGHGKGSGVQVESPGGIVFDFGEGKISCARGYLGRSEALRAVGLEE